MKPDELRKWGKIFIVVQLALLLVIFVGEMTDVIFWKHRNFLNYASGTSHVVSLGLVLIVWPLALISLFTHRPPLWIAAILVFILLIQVFVHLHFFPIPFFPRLINHPELRYFAIHIAITLYGARCMYYSGSNSSKTPTS